MFSNIYCDYIQSAQLEDELKIQSQFLLIQNASFQLEQNIFREKDIIFHSKVLLVNINSSGKPIKIPETLLSLTTVARTVAVPKTKIVKQPSTQPSVTNTSSSTDTSPITPQPPLPNQQDTREKC